ncbi:uncharacterized protein LOC130793967 isoform X2 [Actinidia eriantha]|uniref:uncharacterized protein LOC130793967 isoform X2 n=1 Tax=Actinidia eriantha TaxID=165200 RepID=UPI002588A918|nr:uncharacterized protein LOC130793967 isoform X2 [Actinidia eriantha]
MAETEETFKEKHLLLSPQLKSPIKPNPILTKLWELLHLLFIGIAVSYGLFGRKKAGTENEVETQSKLDNPQTYLSGFLHFPSIFEDWCENPYESDEKRQIQTWNSQNFNGGPMVFVSRENCVIEDLGKPKSVIDHKPLGLPIRSLRSKTTDRDAPESVKRNESGSDSDKIKNGKFRGLIPIDLEEKFKETVSIPSPLPWGSRSSRMEVREDMNSTSKSHSHSKHISIAESEFDYLKSESFWSPIFSQRNSSMPSKETRDSKIEDLERDKSSCLSASKLRNGFSIGSLSEMNCYGDLKEFSRSIREDPLGGGSFGVDSRKTEVKIKPFQRGKSVRTIRASENRVFEGGKIGEICSNHVEGNEGNTNFDKFGDFSVKESSKLSEKQNEKVQDFAESNGVEDEKDSESEFEKFHVSSGEEEEEEEEEEKEKEEEQEQEEEKEEEEEEFDENFDNDAEFDAFEVDKKAGEFIAKFREQIRLQKIAANKGFSGW